MTRFSGDLLTHANVQATAAVKTLRGDQRIKNMAASPPYAAPVQTTPAVVTEATSHNVLATTNYGYADVRLRWPGYVDTSTGAANPRSRTVLTGAGYSASVSYTSVNFGFDGRYFDVVHKPNAGAAYRIWVNQKAHSATMVNVVTTGASQAYLQVDLGSTSYGQPRDILVEMENTSGSQIVFYGLWLEPNATLTAPLIPSPRWMIVGDSYTNGVGATYKAYGFATSLGRLMGWAETWSQMTGVASTGLVKLASSTDGAYINRLATDVVKFAPDGLLLQGSINDNPYGGTGRIRQAAIDYVTEFRRNLPNSPVVLTSPFQVGNPTAANLLVRDEMKAAATALGCPFIDILSPALFSGSGKVGATTGSGNGDFYAASDGTHPTDAGHFYLANELAYQLSNALGLAA